VVSRTRKTEDIAHKNLRACHSCLPLVMVIRSIVISPCRMRFNENPHSPDKVASVSALTAALSQA
jgi:hypothetical protein